MVERLPLTRVRIAASALAFVDAHGEAALSMRKLGAELGVEAMSLYNHVTNKDDLLDAVAELLIGEVLKRYQPESSWSWQHDARELAHIYRSVAYEHPRAFPIMADRGIPSSLQFVFHERVWQIFTKAGFPTKEAGLAFDSVASWVVGVVRQDLGTMSTMFDEDPADHAILTSHERDVADFTAAVAAWTPEQRFDFGLDTLILGLEAQLLAL